MLVKHSLYGGAQFTQGRGSKESLKALDRAFPIQIPRSKAKIFIHRRSDDNAYYVDEAGWTVGEPRPSASTEPGKR